MRLAWALTVPTYASSFTTIFPKPGGVLPGGEQGDGKPSECCLLDYYPDHRIQEFLLEMNNPPVELLLALHKCLYRRARPDGIVSFIPDLLLGELGGLVRGDSQLMSAAKLLERQGLLVREHGGGDLVGELGFVEPLGALMAKNESRHATILFTYRMCQELER